MANNKYDHLKTLIFLILPLSLFSCAGSGRISADMNSRRTSLSYLYQMNINQDKNNALVKVNPVVCKAYFPDSVVVKRKNAFSIPLVIFYYWRANHHCYIGKKNIRENPSDFIRQSFIETAERAAWFTATKDSGNYTLDITIDTISSSGPYLQEGFVFFRFYYSKQVAGPATAFLGVSYTLKKGDEVILTGGEGRKNQSSMIAPKARNGKALRRTYSVNMVEALSQSIKEVTEAVVGKVDEYTRQTNPETK